MSSMQHESMTPDPAGARAEYIEQAIEAIEAAFLSNTDGPGADHGRTDAHWNDAIARLVKFHLDGDLAAAHEVLVEVEARADEEHPAAALRLLAFMSTACLAQWGWQQSDGGPRASAEDAS